MLGVWICEGMQAHACQTLCSELVPSDNSLIVSIAQLRKHKSPILSKVTKLSVWESQKLGAAPSDSGCWLLMASRKDHKEKTERREENRSQAFTWLSFSALPARRNPLGSFKDYRLQAHASGDTDFLDLREQPRLRDLFFKVESHYIRETVIGIQ